MMCKIKNTPSRNMHVKIIFALYQTTHCLAESSRLYFSLIYVEAKLETVRDKKFDRGYATFPLYMGKDRRGYLV